MLKTRPFSTATCHVIAQGRAVLIRIHLKTDDPAAVHVDDHPMNHRDDFVAGQRILPRLQRRMIDSRVDQVHFADVPLILLKRRNFFGIGRPQEDGPFAACPSGVVGGIAEILHAVGGQRRLGTRGDVAHPEIPVADERGLRPVR